MKTKVSLTLEEDLLKEAKGLVDGIAIRNTSQAVEHLMRTSLRSQKTAVILAGGNSKSLLTGGTYRPLLDIGGQTIIENNIERIRRIFSRVLIVGRNEVLGAMFKVLGDGSKHGVKITYIEEKDSLGTAKTLELAKPYLNGTFLFLPCDHYFDFNIEDLLSFHRRNKADITLSVFQKTNFNWPVAVVEMEGSKITGYEERPRKPRTHLRSMLIGCAEPSIFSQIPKGKVRWDLQDKVFPNLASKGRLYGYPVAGNWVNVSSKKDLNLIKRLHSK